MIDSRKLTDWYDLQAPFYRLWRNRYHGALASRIVDDVRSLPRHGRVLDAGCGTGLVAVVLARALPDSRVVGIDLSEGMLRVAARESRRFSLTRLALSRADVQALPFARGTFDVVIAAGLFPNLNESGPALRELSRVLAADGVLLVVEFDRESLGASTRLFFRVMILGQRWVSHFFPRFRFADTWDLRASTIDRAAFGREVAAVGLRSVAVATRERHLVFRLVKADPRAAS